MSGNVCGKHYFSNSDSTGCPVDFQVNFAHSFIPLSGENRKSKINKQDVRGRCAGLQITSGGKYIHENFVCRSFLNFRFDKIEMMI